jgi:hypothetical protein
LAQSLSPNNQSAIQQQALQIKTKACWDSWRSGAIRTHSILEHGLNS